MVALLVFVALVVLLVAYVWRQQVRHPVAPGRHLDPEAQAQQDGRFEGGR